MVNHQFEDLPTHLSERIRVHSESSNENGHFVLYWMRTAVRADENPALEVAIRLANQQRLPLLVYQAISQHHDYASDRHHMFMLEGARDVQMQFLHRGISYAFHLATRDDCGSHLKTLAEQATMVVTEEMPVDPTSERCFFDAESGIAACGDWAGGPRVEGAFLSGMAAAGRILGTLSMKRNTTASQLKLF